MSKPLETLLPGFTPSPLQQAAIKRIREYKQELAEYGFFVQSALELEFTVEDDQAGPIRCVMDLKKARRHFDDDPRISPYIERLVWENDLGPRFADDRSAKYEITAADAPAKDDAGRIRHTAPEALACVVEHIKKDSIRQMLRDSTYLSNGTPLPALHPNFMARPYHEPGNESRGPRNNVSNSLHINVSLCDNNGRNMFSESANLLAHCANALLEVQREAGLAMMPNGNSVARLQSLSSAPHTLGIQNGKNYSAQDPDMPSICLRNDMVDWDRNEVIRDKKFTRIENKLPGSDTDPFVGMAVTMAGLVKAVREHVKKAPSPDGRSVRLTVDKEAPLETERYAMPAEHRTWTEMMRQSTRMRDLLGEKLYTAILNEYGQGAAR